MQQGRVRVNKRIDRIEVLRGLAALTVSWFHLTNSHDGWAKTSGSQGFLPPRCLLLRIGIPVFRRLLQKDPVLLTLVVIAACGVVMTLHHLLLPAAMGIATALILQISFNANLRSSLWRPLLWLGTISYSLYLVHLPIGGRIVNLLGRFLPQSPTGELFASLAALAASLAFATLFYWLIDKPAIRASRPVRARSEAEKETSPHG